MAVEGGLNSQREERGTGQVGRDVIDCECVWGGVGAGGREGWVHGRGWGWVRGGGKIC